MLNFCYQKREIFPSFPLSCTADSPICPSYFSCALRSSIRHQAGAENKEPHSADGNSFHQQRFSRGSKSVYACQFYTAGWGTVTARPVKPYCSFMHHFKIQACGQTEQFRRLQGFFYEPIFSNIYTCCIPDKAESTGIYIWKNRSLKQGASFATTFNISTAEEPSSQPCKVGYEQVLFVDETLRLRKREYATATG